MRGDRLKRWSGGNLEVSEMDERGKETEQKEIKGKIK